MSIEAGRIACDRAFDQVTLEEVGPSEYVPTAVRVRRKISSRPRVSTCTRRDTSVDNGRASKVGMEWRGGRTRHRTGAGRAMQLPDVIDKHISATASVAAELL